MLNGQANDSLNEVIQMVQSSVTQFVQAGERLGQKYPSIATQMAEVCPLANRAGRITNIQRSNLADYVVSCIESLYIAIITFISSCEYKIIDPHFSSGKVRLSVVL